jgi:hypothetical protein
MLRQGIGNGWELFSNNRFNRQCVFQFARHVRKPVFRCLAVAGKCFLTKTMGQFVRQLSDDRTGRLPMVLDLVEGMPVTITKNQAPEAYIANGAIGFVCHIEMHPANEIIRTYDDGVEINHCSELPLAVYIQMLGMENQPLFPGCPNGVVPVILTQQKTTLNFGKATSESIMARKKTAFLQQLPIVPAFAMTAEKVQGLTLEGAYWCPKGRTGQSSAFHVVTTRVKTLDGFGLVDKLDVNQLRRHYRPDALAMAEETRLKALERQVG